jgi:hypothetical protein
MLNSRQEIPQIADFIKKILNKYNGTPDEWEEFYSLRDLSEIECFNRYRVKAANEYKTHIDNISVETITVPACIVLNTESMQSITLIVCINNLTNEAIRFITPFKYQFFSSARKALLYKNYINPEFVIPIIDMLGKDIFSIMQEYEINENDGKKYDAHLNIARRFIKGESVKKEELE